MNRQGTKAKNFQAKLNLPVKQASKYKYSLNNNIITLQVPLKGVENKPKYFIDLKIKINNTESMAIDEIFIDMQSFLDLLIPLNRI
jgi:hypothetical protein